MEYKKPPSCLAAGSGGWRHLLNGCAVGVFRRVCIRAVFPEHVNARHFVIMVKQVSGVKYAHELVPVFYRQVIDALPGKNAGRFRHAAVVFQDHIVYSLLPSPRRSAIPESTAVLAGL